MLMNTHMIMANNIIKQASYKKNSLINKNRFMWGNLKPDCASKYKFKKHYYDESIEMIIEKIKELSSLSVSEIYNDFGKKKFSGELGVICHFICDYFCLPHNQRWEFKKAIKRHVKYENTLAKIAKAYVPIGRMDANLQLNEINEFIINNIKEYEKEKGYVRDLEYSHFVCNSIVNLILNEIYMNEYNKERRAV